MLRFLSSKEFICFNFVADVKIFLNILFLVQGNLSHITKWELQIRKFQKLFSTMAYYCPEYVCPISPSLPLSFLLLLFKYSSAFYTLLNFS